MTVGNDASGESSRAFAKLGNGAAWTDTRPRQGARATASYLLAVSCPSRRVCVAVGDYDTDADPLGRPYAQIFSGGKWKITPVPEPPNDSFSGLGAVSCANARMCVATGKALRRRAQPDLQRRLERTHVAHQVAGPARRHHLQPTGQCVLHRAALLHRLR